jgi:V/A-type H+-transporting ATPase subunit C
MPRAVKEAAEVLGTTGDPQRSDFVLDQAYYSEMLACAEQSGSAFLKGYVQVSIDAANLRSAVRALRLGKGADFLRRVLFEGGAVPAGRVMSAALSGSIAEPYRSGSLRTAGELGAEATSGGPLTAFEKACDDAVTAVVAEAKRVPFGIEVVIGYLVAKELEFAAVRIIMSGRMAGLSGNIIRERLRESYV